MNVNMIMSIIESNEEEIKELENKIKALRDKNQKLNKIVEDYDKPSIVISTYVKLHNENYYVDDIIIVDGRINITDLPFEIQQEAKSNNGYVENCKAMVGDKGSFVEFRIQTRDYGAKKSIEDFKNLYNEFINDPKLAK